MIQLMNEIKSLGEFKVKINLHSEIQAEIGPRRDKRNSTQVYSAASFGAVRMEEEKMIEIKCDEP